MDFVYKCTNLFLNGEESLTLENPRYATHLGGGKPRVYTNALETCGKEYHNCRGAGPKG